MKLVVLTLLCCAVYCQTTWNVVDLTQTASVPTSNLPVTYLNSTAYLIVGNTNNHVYLVVQQSGTSYVIQDLSAPTDGSDPVPTTNITLTTFGSGPWPKLSFAGINMANGHVFNAFFYLYSFPIWTVFDMTNQIGAPSSRTPVTLVNGDEYIIVEETTGNVTTVVYDPTNLKFTMYDVTATAGIPATSVAVQLFYNIYPNIQFVSQQNWNGHIFASYFNQPTSTGWAVYDLTQAYFIPPTNCTPAVQSSSQFFTVNQANGHVNSNLYTSGVWVTQDLTLTVNNFPATPVTPTVFLYNPVGLLVVNGVDFHIINASYSTSLNAWVVTDMTATYNWPSSFVPVTARDSTHFIVTATDGHVYLISSA